MTDEVKRSLSQARLRFNSRSPFFSVLIGNLRIEQVPDDDEIQTAATDGSSLYINGPFWMAMPPPERDFVLAHEVLHIAFKHMNRCGNRDHDRWNAAGDYAINWQLSQLGFTMPPVGLIDQKYKDLTADEIYSLLPTGPCKCCKGMIGNGTSEEEARRWGSVLDKAVQMDRMYGNSSMNKFLKYGEFAPIVDWRAALWNIMGNASDFDGYDRRMVHSETYVEELVDRSDTKGMCAVILDTSGSTMPVLGQFIAEVQQIVDLYQLDCPLYWADADIIGPLKIEEIDKPMGGGGTSFVPFFEEVERKGYERVVYFTDLEGLFPKSTNADVLWVVPAGTRAVPPFGRVVKIMKEEK